jgi:hypothetical protein
MRAVLDELAWKIRRRKSFAAPIEAKTGLTRRNDNKSSTYRYSEIS